MNADTASDALTLPAGTLDAAEGDRAWPRASTGDPKGGMGRASNARRGLRFLRRKNCVHPSDGC